MIVQTIISRALRRIGTLGGGETPRSTESADALDTLKSLYQRWITEGAFGPLCDVIASAGDYVACENTRVYRNDVTTTSITLPETVANDSANGLIDDYGQGYFYAPVIEGIGFETRLPRDGSVIVVIDAFTTGTVSYIYDGSIKRWCDISTLDYGDTAPLSQRDSSGLSACLAVELADEFGASPSALTINSAQRFQMGLSHNYSFAGDLITPVSYI